jgi:hypothetical protein
LLGAFFAAAGFAATGRLVAIFLVATFLAAVLLLGAAFTIRDAADAIARARFTGAFEADFAPGFAAAFEADFGAAFTAIFFADFVAVILRAGMMLSWIPFDALRVRDDVSV